MDVLELDECDRIRELNASQYIGRACGYRQLVELNYHDMDFSNGFENHLVNLENTIRSGGIVLGAFFKERLVGFCSVNNTVFVFGE